VVKLLLCVEEITYSNGIGRTRVIALLLLIAVLDDKETALRWYKTKDTPNMFRCIAGSEFIGTTNPQDFEEDTANIKAQLEKEGMNLVDGKWSIKMLETHLTPTNIEDWRLP
jgi:hypothetical protein